MNRRPPVLVYSSELESLRYPPDCPFKPERAVALRRRLLSFGLLQEEVPARQATRAEVERFHTRRYLDELERAAAGDLRVEGLQIGLGTPDTPVFRDLFTLALWASGASLAAADYLLNGKADIVFTPWGGFHHAHPEKASGFCYVNDVALACHRLADAGRRVLFLDVDAHHGDGVQAAFYQRKDVMTLSLHESGHTLFPWGGFEDEIGEGEGRGYNINVPLPAETYDAAYRLAYRSVALPLIGAFRPEVIVLELGMDTLAGDPLTHLRLTNNVHEEILRSLLTLERPILVTGGGGYHVENTVRGWALAWKTLQGEEEHDMSFGMGGVMLQSAEWVGGLRDHELPVSPQQRAAVEPTLHDTLRKVTGLVFPIHGLPCME